MQRHPIVFNAFYYSRLVRQAPIRYTEQTRHFLKAAVCGKPCFHRQAHNPQADYATD